MSLTLEPVDGLPEFGEGDAVGELIGKRLNNKGIELNDADVIVVAQKIVSKSEGAAVELETIEPGPLAGRFAPEAGKDPRVIQAILDHSERIIKMENGVIISETTHGFICANAGLDTSNIEQEGVILPLPEDPDRSARRIRDQIDDETGTAPAVVISDTWGRPWREGQVNFAIGVSGMGALRDYRGETDTNGQELEETIIAEADELASAAELVMGKTREVPAVLVRGYHRVGEQGTGQELVRPAEKDFFR